LLAISFFITKKFKFQQLAADIADQLRSTPARDVVRLGRRIRLRVNPFDLRQAVELKQVERRLAGAKRERSSAFARPMRSRAFTAADMRARLFIETSRCGSAALTAATSKGHER
jgi:hypothetical protein